MTKERINVDTINSLGGFLKEYQRMTEELETNPERAGFYKGDLSAMKEKAYAEVIIPLYNALSHGSLMEKKISFSKLLQHIGFNESLVAQQEGEGLTSDRKTILGKTKDDTTFHSLFNYDHWGSVGKIMGELN